MPDAPPVIRAACSTHRVAFTVQEAYRGARWMVDEFLVEHAECGRALTCCTI